MNKIHENIEVPKVPFCKLPKDEQELITHLAESLVKQLGVDMSGIENPVGTTIGFIEKGLLRICVEEGGEGISFELFDFESGKYLPVDLSTEH